MAESVGADDTRALPGDTPLAESDARPIATPAGDVAPDADLPEAGCHVLRALAHERQHVDGLRAGDAQAVRGNPNQLPVGLALSGGGIRSATVCLGALQALAEGDGRGGMLRHIDYLSTVSGGGYIGAWFSAVLRRFHQKGAADPIGGMEKLLSPAEIRQKDTEPIELAFLRAYSNYLTPRLGPFSGDTLAAVTGYLRNLLLSQLLAVCSAGLLLSLLHVVMAGIGAYGDSDGWFATMNHGARILLAMAAALASLLLTLQSLDPRTQILPGEFRQLVLKALQWTQDIYGRVMLPLVATGLLLAGLALEARLPFRLPWDSVVEVGAWALVIFALGAVFAYTIIDLAGRMRDGIEVSDVAVKSILSVWGLKNRMVSLVVEKWRESFRYALAGVVSSLVAWWLLDLCGRLSPAHPAIALFRGPALAAGVACAVFMVWLGAVGTTYSELTREWISRLLGVLAGVTLGWLTIGAVLVNARPVVYWLGSVKRVVLFQAAWILPTAAVLVLFTLLSQRRPGGADAPPGPLSRAVVPVACGAVTLLFMAAMTVGFQEASVRLAGASALTDAAATGASYTTVLDAALSDLTQAMSRQAMFSSMFDASGLASRLLGWTTVPVVSLLLVSLLAAALAFRYIDVNVFSLQNLYRNRLVRCYLGAARHDERQQNPYAGFDPADDIEVASLAGQRPYPLINTALNITQGDDLAWQQRKAASFCFSPLWSGYWLEAADLATARLTERVKGGYATTARYALEPSGATTSNGVMLGTAMATSGAAVSSQMGFASQGLLAFVLTLFNVRLGRWFPNTAGREPPSHLARHSPRYAGAWYLNELLGRTNEKSAWVYLSDGGHFENLAIYELVRRRCRFIIAVHAGADPKMSFGDLGNCVRKCRVDFGVNIRLDLSEFGVTGAPARPAVSHISGKIDYPGAPGDPPFVGDIVYIKSSLPTSGDHPPADIVSFQCEHPLFPHQSTSDQWFTEAQFESYRQLGYWITHRALGAVRQGFDRIEKPATPP